MFCSDATDIGVVVCPYHARRCRPNTSYIYRGLNDGGIQARTRQ
jgi:hypothetical protein